MKNLFRIYKYEPVYDIIGVREDGKIRKYQSGTIKQIEENEILNQMQHKNINDILRDMDCFSDYKHYAKEIK